MALVREKHPRWKRRPEARPSEIAEAALEVFARAGFEAATMDEIASKAGVSKGTVYLYFPGKEDLLVAAVEHRIRANQAIVLPLLMGSTGGIDGTLTRERVRKILTELIDRVISVITSPETLMTLQVVIAERRRSPQLRKRQTELVNVAFGAIVDFKKLDQWKITPSERPEEQIEEIEEIREENEKSEVPDAG